MDVKDWGRSREWKTEFPTVFPWYTQAHVPAASKRLRALTVNKTHTVITADLPGPRTCPKPTGKAWSAAHNQVHSKTRIVTGKGPTERSQRARIALHLLSVSCLGTNFHSPFTPRRDTEMYGHFLFEGIEDETSPEV